MELLELTELQQVLQEYANDAVEIYKYQIALGGKYGNKNASRNLTDNVVANVVVGDNAYEVTLTLQDYWKYIEGGTKGLKESPIGAKYKVARPPIDKLIDWINIKPIIPKPGADGHIPSPKELAFLIHRKIRDYGIEPFPALKETKRNLMEIYRERLSIALGHDVEAYIRKLVREK